MKGVNTQTRVFEIQTFYGRILFNCVYVSINIDNQLGSKVTTWFLFCLVDQTLSIVTGPSIFIEPVLYLTFYPCPVS